MNRFVLLAALVAVSAASLVAFKAPPPKMPVLCSQQIAEVNVSGDYDNSLVLQVDIDGYDTSTGCVLDSIDFYETADESSLIEMENESTTNTVDVYNFTANTCLDAYPGLAGVTFYRTSAATSIWSRLWQGVDAGDYSPPLDGSTTLAVYDGTGDYDGTSGKMFTHSSHLTRVPTASTSNATDLAKFSHASVRIYYKLEWLHFIDTQLPTLHTNGNPLLCTQWSISGNLTNSNAQIGANLRAVYHGH
jgi:hypothetical protein